MPIFVIELPFHLPLFQQPLVAAERDLSTPEHDLTLARLVLLLLLFCVLGHSGLLDTLLKVCPSLCVVHCCDRVIDDALDGFQLGVSCGGRGRWEGVAVQMCGHVRGLYMLLRCNKERMCESAHNEPRHRSLL